MAGPARFADDDGDLGTFLGDDDDGDLALKYVAPLLYQLVLTCD